MRVMSSTSTPHLQEPSHSAATGESARSGSHLHRKMHQCRPGTPPKYAGPWSLPPSSSGSNLLQPRSAAPPKGCENIHGSSALQSTSSFPDVADPEALSIHSARRKRRPFVDTIRHGGKRLDHERVP